MAAPEIPDLRTLLPSRGRGRGAHSSGGQSRKPKSADAIIQETDYDARDSHLSAVEAGYLMDPFARAFVKGHVPRRVPILNRGTYLRTHAIDTLVDSFLASFADITVIKPTCQIISLGAGSDTRYFRLAQRFLSTAATSSPNEKPRLPFVYHELDMPGNTREKVKKLYNGTDSPFLPMVPGSFSVGSSQDGFRSTHYCIHPCDLRSLRPRQASEPLEAHALLASWDGVDCSYPGIDTDLPTLIISECCLVYLHPAEATAALQFFTSLFQPNTPLSIIIYEPINPFDPFGKVMEQNLASRGITLHGLKEWHSLEKQKERITQFLCQDGAAADVEGGAGVADINEIWRSWISEEEKERVSKLEMVDEVEEWGLLAAHYCVAWGWRGGGREQWDRWRRLGQS